MEFRLEPRYTVIEEAEWANTNESVYTKSLYGQQAPAELGGQLSPQSCFYIYNINSYFLRSMLFLRFLNWNDHKMHSIT